jgi:hypothetical protein
MPACWSDAAKPIATRNGCGTATSACAKRLKIVFIHKTPFMLFSPEKADADSRRLFLDKVLLTF